MPDLTLEVVEVDGRMVVDGPTVKMTGDIAPTGELMFKDDHPAEPEPEPGPPASNGDLEDMIEKAVAKVILNAPVMEGEVDERDVVPTISHEKLWLTRWRDAPLRGRAPAIVTSGSVGTRGTINIVDEGAKEGDLAACSKALTETLRKIPDGGKAFIPFGKWPVANIPVPGHKDLIIEGETELGAELVSVPGKDMLVWSDDNTQRRLQNRPIIRNLRFFMRGDGKRGNFKRKTNQGYAVGAACLSWVQKSPTDDGNRKKAWGNSYVTVQNCTARGEKDAVGAAFLYSDRALYGLRVQNLMIGDHGTSVSGLPVGLAMGVPPFPTAEYAPDETGIDHFVHWGGHVSIAISNIANGHIRDHKAYSCRWPLHLTGQENNGPRKRSRGMYVEGYYDNDVVDTGPTDQEMLHLAVDNCTFGVLHFKGSRHGRARPTLEISGSNLRGGIFEIMDSGSHQAPQFKISGSGHQFAVDAAGMASNELNTLFNGKSSYPGVTVL